MSALPRLTPDTMKPGLFGFLLNLSIDICIDKRAFHRWRSANYEALRAEFVTTGQDDEYFVGWAMEQFANRAVPV